MPPTLEVPTHHGHQPPHVSNRFRSGIRKLLPFTKTATFLVRVTIHDVTNVPLMNGRFSVRWKFRGGRGGEITERSYSSSEHLPQHITLTRASTDDALAAHIPHASSTSTTSSSQFPSPASSSTIPPHSADTIRTPIPNTSFPQPPHSSPNPYSTFASSPLATNSARLKKASMESASLSISSQSSMSRRSTLDSHTATSPVVGLFSENSLLRSESPDRLSATSGRSVSEDESVRTGVERGENRRDTSTTDVAGGSRLAGIIKGERSSRSDSLSNRWKGKSKATERSPASESNIPKPNHRPDDHPGDASRKGHTPVRDLKDHACSWDYDLVQTVRMDIRPIHHSESSTALNKHLGGHQHLDEEARAHAQSIGMLGGGLKSESGLKLTILQNVEVAKAHNKEGEPLLAAQQFGVVNLNLAEYACEEGRMGKGGITRRYLLKEGKTNATIRLTIDLEQIGGEKEYHTPQLQKGQVVAGLTAFTNLGQNEPLLAPIQNRRKRPGSSASSSSVATMGNLTISASTSSQSLSEKRSMRSLRKGKSAEADQRHDPGRHATSSPADSEHPHAHHPHHYHTHRSHHRHRHQHAPTLTTDEVIHGIFNPRPSKEVGPFFTPLDSGIILNQYEDDGDPDPEEDGGLQIPLGGKRKDRERRPIANGRLWSTFRHPTRGGGGGGGGGDTPRSGIGPGGTPLGEKRFNWYREASPEKAKRVDSSA